MIESFLVISIIGLLAGFFFSVPIAGPISILITSNALKGRFKFCMRTAIGGAIVEFFYVFIAVYGLTSLYSYYQNAIPIILIAGSLFLIFVAYKIIGTKLKLEDLSKNGDNKYHDGKGGTRTGFILNLTNPSLFLGWFTSSFLLLSFASSIGLNTGGLDLLMHENVSNMEEITGKEFESFEDYKNIENDTPSPINDDGDKSLSSLILSLTYAFMVSLGSTIWFYILVKFLINFREKLNINWLNGLIKILGVFLFGISFYLIYEGIRIWSKMSS